MAQQLGVLIWTLLMPLFFLGVIWCIQFIRTRDKSRARGAALSRNAIIFSIALWLFVILSRLA